MLEQYDGHGDIRRGSDDVSDWQKYALSTRVRLASPQYALRSASGWHPRKGGEMPSPRPNDAISYTVHTITRSKSGVSYRWPRVWSQEDRVLQGPRQRGELCASAAFRRRLYGCCRAVDEEDSHSNRENLSTRVEHVDYARELLVDVVVSGSRCMDSGT